MSEFDILLPKTITHCWEISLRLVELDFKEINS